MAINPIQQVPPGNLYEAPANTAHGNSGATNQAPQTQQDKVTISSTAKQGSNGNGTKASGTGDTDHDGDSR